MAQILALRKRSTSPLNPHGYSSSTSVPNTTVCAPSPEESNCRPLDGLGFASLGNSSLSLFLSLFASDSEALYQVMSRLHLLKNENRGQKASCSYLKLAQSDPMDYRQTSYRGPTKDPEAIRGDHDQQIKL